MATNSNIEWCKHTANLWWGCNRVHRGCDFCYAAALAERFGHDVWDNDKRKYVKSVWGNFQKWDNLAAKEGIYSRVFVGSMMDIFEKAKPVYQNDGSPLIIDGLHVTTNDLRVKFLHKIVPSNQHIMFMLLTKRPSNINKMIPAEWLENPPRNVMFGASVVDTQSLKDVSRHMAKVKGYTFYSVEPLLERIDLKKIISDGKMFFPDWVILGGESGPNKRHFDTDWAREWLSISQATHTPFFMKQVDKVRSIPDDLMIRQVPSFAIGFN